MIFEFLNKVIDNLTSTNKSMPLSANQGRVLKEEVDKANTELKNKVLPQYKAFNLTATGWYRIAEFTANQIAEILGHFGNGCDIDIRKLYAFSSSENHTIKFRSSNTKSDFVDEVSIGEGFDITKIRYTYDSTNLKAYIEIYYNSTKGNTVSVHLSNQRAVSFSDVRWNLIDFVATSETVSGITVLTTHEFSQNKSYESEIKAVLSAKAIPSDISTIKGLADVATVDTSYFASNSDALTDYPEALKKFGATMYVYITIKVKGTIRYVEIIATTSNGTTYTIDGYTSTTISGTGWGRGSASLNADITALQTSLGTTNTNVSALQTKASTHDSSISALQTNVTNIKNAFTLANGTLTVNLDLLKG